MDILPPHGHFSCVFLGYVLRQMIYHKDHMDIESPDVLLKHAASTRI
jgi:hypothetical protein